MTAARAESIVRGRHVICGIDPDGRARIVDDGAVWQRDGVILEIASFDALRTRAPGVEVLGGVHDVVLPGFVNAHHHTGLTPIQHGVLYEPVEFWLPEFMGFRAVDPGLDTLYSAIEMVESGVTTVQHIYGSPLGSADRWHEAPDAIIGAYARVGMRVSFSFMLRDRNRIVYGGDEEFVAGLPPDLRGAVSAFLAERTAPAEAYLGFFEELARRWNPRTSATVRVQLAPANHHWCTDEALERQRDTAERFDVGLHMHLLETPYQGAFAERTVGRSAVEHLAKLGLLGPRLTIGHGIWMSRQDLDLVASSGTLVCHNPSSGLRVQSGIAPVAALVHRGVRVALGIDQAGINDDRDILQEMRLAWCLQRGAGHGADVLDAAQVFRMATEHGAATTGFADTIGTLAPGRAADIVLMDWREVAHPYLDPRTPLIEALLHRAKAHAVHTVLVGGTPIMRDHRLVGVSKADVHAALAEQLARPLTSREEERRALARALRPHIAAFYRSWATPRAAGAYNALNPGGTA